MHRRKFFVCGIVLLNLSGLGLGYVVLRQWRRWKNYLLITAALWILAVMLKAYQMPRLWGTLLGLWLLLSLLDGWHLAVRTEEGSFSTWWLLPLLGLFTCLIAWGGVFFYRYAAGAVYARAVQAYQTGDCRTASTDFETYQSLYRFSLLPVLENVEKYSQECELLLYAAQAEQTGYYEEALNTLQYLSATALQPEAKRQQVQVSSSWARALASQANYQQAIEILSVAVTAHTDENQRREIDDLAAGIALEWGDHIYEQGDYMNAANIYRKVINSYAGSSHVGDARRRIAAAYFAEAQVAYEQQNWSEALSAYQYLRSEFADLSEVQPSRQRMRDLYLRQAETSYAAADYATVIQAYTELVQEDPAYFSEGELHLKLSQLYAEWAQNQRENGGYEQAVNIYALLQNDYADTVAGKTALEEMPYVQLAWVDDLAYNDQFDLALQKLEQMRNAYPYAPLADHIAEKYLELNLLWGQSLYEHQQYSAAMQKYNDARRYMYSYDQAAINRALNGYQQALTALTNDNGPDGSQVLSQALQQVCQGLAPLSPAVGLSDDLPLLGLSCSPDLFDLPAVRQANTPGRLRFVVAMEKGEQVVGECNQGGGLVQRKQIWLDVTLRNASTARLTASKRFLGDLPADCSSSFQSDSEIVGPLPDGILTWIEQIYP